MKISLVKDCSTSLKMYFTCHAYIKGKHKLQSKLVSLLAMTQDLV